MIILPLTKHITQLMVSKIIDISVRKKKKKGFITAGQHILQ